MCHTLLQYYIHCGHVCTHFYSCIIPPSSTPVRDSRGREQSYIHPNYAPSSENGEMDENKETCVHSDWRDHSVPRSIAHSYHRVCPGCFTDKKAQDREHERQEWRRRGVELWRQFSDDAFHSATDSGSDSMSTEEARAEGEDLEDDEQPVHDGGTSRSLQTGAVHHLDPLISPDVSIRSADRRVVRESDEPVDNAAQGPVSRYSRVPRSARLIQLASEMGVQLSRSETLEQWEQRILARLNEPPSLSTTATGTNGQLQNISGLWTPMPPGTSVSRPNPDQGEVQNSLAPFPPDRLGPHVLERQARAQTATQRLLSQNPEPSADQLRRTVMLDQAIADERTRIQSTRASRGLPPMSEEEIQGRFQPWRDLYGAPPMLAAISRMPGGSGAAPTPATNVTGFSVVASSASWLDNTAEYERLRTETIEEAEQARARRRARRRRGAIAAEISGRQDSGMQIPRRLLIQSVADAFGIEYEPSLPMNHDLRMLPGLETVPDSQAFFAIEASAPSRSQRSQTPSPEERMVRQSAPFLERFGNQDEYSFPERSFLAEHCGDGDAWDQGCIVSNLYPSHARPEDGTALRADAGLHKGNPPKTFDELGEVLVRDTWELLIQYHSCNHAETVFVERLHVDHQAITASCGCDRFDKRLIASRRAFSRQKCLRCRTSGKEGVDKSAEQYLWLKTHVHKIRARRDLLLWPYGAKQNHGYLEYR